MEPQLGVIESIKVDPVRGKDDRRKTLFKAQFIDGGTVGPASR